MNIDKLQLYRNGVYFENKDAALDALDTIKASAKDGEVILLRYYDIEPEPRMVVDDGNDIVKTIIAVFAIDGENRYVTVYDLQELKEGLEWRLNNVQVNSVEGSVVNDNGYIMTSLVLAAKDINTSKDYTVITYEQVGDTLFDSIVSGDSVEVALSKIESNIDKLIDNIVANELVIAKALTTMNESIGFTQGGMYEVQVDNPILSAATTLYEADIELSAAIIEGQAELNTKIQEVSDRVMTLEGGIPFQSSETIILTDVKDENDNVIAKQFELSQEINIIVESDYENME